MKNRIWNQTKAAVLAMVAILSGICVPFQEMQVSGAETGGAGSEYRTKRKMDR